MEEWQNTMPVSLKNISRVNLHLSRGKVVFGDVIYSPGGGCGPRIQQDYQLVVIHSGLLDLKLDGRAIHVAAGQAILLSPGHQEHFRFARDTETNHGWCAVGPDAVPANMRSIFGALREPAPFGSHLAMLLKLGKTPPLGAQSGTAPENDYFLGLGMALLSGFAMVACAGGANRNAADEARARLEEFVSREYEKPLGLPRLAAAAGVSRQHLLKLFRERGWSTPTEYLYEKRLEIATDLLSHTGLSVGEIALRCGFANPFHFSRKFRQGYGKSPREWRIHSWSGSTRKAL